MLCVDVGSSCEQGVSGSADESVKVFRMSTRKVRYERTRWGEKEDPQTKIKQHFRLLFILGVGAFVALVHIWCRLYFRRCAVPLSPPPL